MNRSEIIAIIGTIATSLGFLYAIYRGEVRPYPAYPQSELTPQARAWLVKSQRSV